MNSCSGLNGWQPLMEAEKKGRARLPRRFQHDRRDLHRPVVPVFSVAQMYLRNLALCFTSLSSAPPLSSTWKFLLHLCPQPTLWLPLLSSKGQEALDMAPYRDRIVLANFIPLSSVAYQFYLFASARGTTYLVGSC